MAENTKAQMHKGVASIACAASRVALIQSFAK
jgi:hypothetical protein